MTTDKQQVPPNNNIYGKPINQVTEFVYLGYKLSSSNDDEVALKYRISLGWAAVGKHRAPLTSKRDIHIKTKVYKIYILPVVLHGLCNGPK